VPTATYSHNSTGGVNTVRRTGVGRYVVTLPNLGALGGTAHATAYGATSNSCQVTNWLVAGAALNVGVRCYSTAGSFADTQFTASFTNRPPRARLGYVWADMPTSAAYTPSTTYQWNSTGGVNTTVRWGVGSYRVRLPGLGAASGHVQVTAYGDTAAGCKVIGWGPSGTAQNVNVRCHTLGGVPVDARYSLTYVNRSGVLWPAASAYVWAHAATTANYTPVAAYRYNTTGGTNTVSRLGVGSYLVRMPGMPLTRGTVHVTAYGGGSQRCNVQNWTTSGVRVLCRTASGAATDTTFDVAFQR